MKTEDREHFKKHGFVAIRNFVAPELLKLIGEIVDDWVTAKIHEWREEGLIKNEYLDLPREQRFFAAWEAAGKPAYGRDSTHYLINDKMYQFLCNKQLVDLAEFLLETPELTASGVQNIRLKHPALPWTVVPWHADMYYWSEFETGDPLKFVVFWIPLQHVDAKSGCLQTVSTTYKTGIDFNIGKGAVAVPEEATKDFPAQSIEMDPGDILCMSELVLHRSVPNTFPRLAWNIDVRYEVAHASGEITSQFGFVVRSKKAPQTVSSKEQWLKKKSEKKILEYANK